jgi:hypothetical protein
MADWSWASRTNLAGKQSARAFAKSKGVLDVKFTGTLSSGLNIVRHPENDGRGERVAFSSQLRRLARSTRVWPALMAVMIAGIAFGALSAVSYSIGLRADPELSFLDPHRAPTAAEAAVAQAINYALRSDEPNDVIFLGDSACHTGINPRSLRVSAYNLGSLRALGPSGFLLTLKAYLQGRKPKLVVVVVTPFCFESDPLSLDGELSGRVVASYGPEIGTVSALERIAFVSKRGAASLWQDADVRDRPLTELERETYRTLESKMRETRGFFCLPGVHGRPHGVPIERPQRPVHPDWDRGVHAMADACNEAGVRLLIRFAPFSAEYRDWRDWTRLERWASELESTHANVAVARPILLPYDPPLMWDGTHVNADGVEKFTPTVANEIEAVWGK